MVTRYLPTFLSSITAFLLLTPGRGAEAEASPDFNRHVRPILSQYCFKCHGMDDKGRKGGLRLDIRDAALAGGKSGAKAIVPGNPDNSELVRRLHADDPEELMPPASTKVKLPKEAADILSRWVKAGAPFAPHWAFVAPIKAPLPTIKNPTWVKNPVDHFILARLEKEGLSPSPEAGKIQLIRRLHLDLTGLPPTPEEVEAFMRSTSPNPYEDTVDRLLASPAYGERWARRWLDLARYADTNGYEKDRARTIWPYRDWVVNALNAGMPFDQFSIKQLAGDLLPNATPEDKIATGFHRNTMLNEEGGIDPLEFRFHAVVDRVNTTSTAWLGLTVACAQCHTHKYDPILHTDYYRMMAFFNNSEEPDYSVPSAQTTAAQEAVLQKIRHLEDSLEERFELPKGEATPLQKAAFLEKRFLEWEKVEAAKAARWEVARPDRMSANMAHLEVLEDGAILASGDITKSDQYTLQFTGKPQRVTGLKLEVLPDESLPAKGPGRAYYEGPKGDFFLSEIQFKTSGRPASVKSVSDTYSKGGIGGSNKVGARFTIDGDPASGWATNGAQGKAHAAVYQFEHPVDLGDGLELTMLFERHYACPLGKFRISFTSDDKPLQALWSSATLEAALATSVDKRTLAEQQLVRRHFLETAPETAEARKQLDALRASLPRLQTTMVIEERPSDRTRPTHLHNRGEFTQPKELLTPGVPAFLPNLARGTKADRLSFARWLFSPENPLTSRVAVNREWQALFGRGLVRTLEDFGYQGEIPLHQELLDWLAVEFRTTGWSLKQLHKLLVMSATYRQDSSIPPALAGRDPHNLYLGRGPRFRLEAEIIRDAALKAAGQLSAKMGGPGVYPSQNPLITKEGAYGAFEWKPSPGEDRYRRTIYTFTKRTAPFAMTGTFDAPTGESCIARRDLSNSPLQALTLLNDVIFQEAAEALGKLVSSQNGDDGTRIDFIFRRVLSRPASDEEKADLAGFLQRQRARQPSQENNGFASNPWVALSRIVLNLDEAVTKN